MTDSGSVRNNAITSDERIRNVLQRHIRKAYDRHDFTREELVRESGVSISQIDQIMAGDSLKHRRVACEDAFNLAYTLGDGAVKALVATMKYIARRPDEPDPLNPHMIVASVLPHVSTIATAAADGRIDYSEAPACRDAADQIIATVMPLSSASANERA